VPDGKKTKAIRILVSERMELELRRLADADSRALSDYIGVVLRRHVFGHRPLNSVEGDNIAMGDA
jgi:hypothetical protein